MSLVKVIINSRYLLWLLLALPAYEYLLHFFSPGGFDPVFLRDMGLDQLANILQTTGYYPEMIKDTGLWGVQLLIFTLCITPLSLLIRYWNWGKVVGLWLIVRRKYFGLAGAGYGLIHTLLYMSYTWDLKLIWLEALQWSFGTGWIAIFLLAGISATSNQFSVARMGKWWKQVQRLSYIAIILVLLHWALLDFFLEDVLWWAIPLALVKLVHVGLRFWQKKQRKDAIPKPEPVAT